MELDANPSVSLRRQLESSGRDLGASSSLDGRRPQTFVPVDAHVAVTCAVILPGLRMHSTLISDRNPSRQGQKASAIFTEECDTRVQTCSNQVGGGMW